MGQQFLTKNEFERFKVILLDCNIAATMLVVMTTTMCPYYCMPSNLNNLDNFTQIRGTQETVLGGM